MIVRSSNSLTWLSWHLLLPEPPSASHPDPNFGLGRTLYPCELTQSSPKVLLKSSFTWLNWYAFFVSIEEPPRRLWVWLWLEGNPQHGKRDLSPSDCVVTFSFSLAVI